MNIVSFIIAIGLLVLVLKLISLPFKIIIKFIVNSILGGIFLAVLSVFGIGITITGLMVVLTGFLGIPGTILAIIISAIF